MAQDRPKQNQPRASATGPGPADGIKKRLAIMPLAALLPQVTELSQLATFRGEFEARLEMLQGEQESGSEEGDTKRLGEEAMLFQVLQWLNLGGNT